MDYLTENGHVGEPLAAQVTAIGLFELARRAGFDTYEDFVRWRRENPDEYERWYAGILRR